MLYHHFNDMLIQFLFLLATTSWQYFQPLQLQDPIKIQLYGVNE